MLATRTAHLILLDFIIMFREKISILKIQHLSRKSKREIKRIENINFPKDSQCK
jgi:hypothetical protein